MSGRKVRIGIIGVGNCASSLVQGLTYYHDADGNEPVPGLMNVDLGGYHVSDIEVAAAFDIAAAKVGRDVAEAIYAAPNNTQRFADVEPIGVVVQRGQTLDGIGKYLQDMIAEADSPVADVAGELRRSGVDVLVSYLPVGSQNGDRMVCRAGARSRLRLRQLHPGVHRLETRMAHSASTRAACRSSATTSRARWAPPSSTACWPTCSASAASRSTAPISSISAATPIS